MRIVERKLRFVFVAEIAMASLENSGSYSGIST
jgi:hypothetical protein